ncbi:MAG: GNAT family N-acetyltransferase [Bacteroidales bacterium]
MGFFTVPLNSEFDKEAFNSGNQILDRYLKEIANQDIKRKLASCFVHPDLDSNHITGYFTLSNSSIPPEMIPYKLKKKLPRGYQQIPVTLLGRLAVDVKFQGQGIGKLLLFDALKRSFLATNAIGSYAVVVDPTDENAEQFYKRYGFIWLPDSGKMFLPMKLINILFENPA